MRAAAMLLLACAAALPARTDEPRRSPADIDAEVGAVMKGTRAKGLALALVEDGRVAYVAATTTSPATRGCAWSAAATAW